MRRKIVKNRNLIISLIIVATLTFLSFFFDQLVVQQENNIRKINSSISNQKIELNKNIFLINSIFNISKDLSYSTQIKKNTLDDAYSRRSLFSNPEDYGNYKDKVLLSGEKGFEKHKVFHDEIFLNIINSHNEKNDLVKFYLKNFKKNKIFNDAINTSEYDLSLLLNDLDKYYFSKEEIENFNKLKSEKVNWELLYSEEDPLYNFYSDSRKKINDLGYIWDLVYATGKDVVRLNLEQFTKYERNLINFSKVKNRKNFYILLSILFQILALTSLMVLFKIIINQEKK